MILWLIGLGCTSSSPPPPALMIVVDQLSADELGAYGNLPTDTPRIDALASRGTRFTRAYSSSTSAGPSRTSLRSGLLPPQHGHREGGDRDGPYGDWAAQAGWAPCDVVIDVSKFNKRSFEDNKCVSSRSDLSVVWVRRGDAVGLAELDAVVGQLADSWESKHPNSMGSLVGLIGHPNGLRTESYGLLTDDLLRVPLMLWGPGQPTNWEINEVTSTVDLGPTMARLAGAKKVFTAEHSGRAYHESTVGYTLFKARPLTGFTRADGRYVEGVHGRWYPAHGEVIRHYEEPESVHPQAARELKDLTAAYGSGEGLPDDAWASIVDPAECRLGVELITKLRAAHARGRPHAAGRIFSRLEREFPDAPILEVLRAELSIKAD